MAQRQRRVQRGVAAVEAGYRDLLVRMASRPARDPDEFDELGGLKRAAREQATSLGHDLKVFRSKHDGRAVSYCSKCKQVVICDAPEGRSYGRVLTEGCE